MGKAKVMEEANLYNNFKLGRLYREEGKYDLARKEFESILSGISHSDDPFVYNSALNEIEILQGKTFLESKPRGLGITLTNRCNIRCIMCSVWQDPWDIPEKTIREITECLPYLERIFWQGGEVFLSPHFEGLLEKISSYPNIRQDINTNGLLIDRKWAGKLVKVNANIIFSIDGITRETYEYIRKGAKFEDLLRAIELLNEHLDNGDGDIHQKTKKCSTIINLVVMKSNYKELEGFIDFAKKHKFERLQITPVDIGNEENIFLHKDTRALRYIEKAIPEILKKAKDYGISVSNWLPRTDYSVSSDIKQPGTNINNSLSCYWPWQFLFMDWGGRVRPQCFCVEPVGNILKNSLEEIWNGKALQIYRQKLFENDCQGWCDNRCVSGKIPKESLSLDYNCIKCI